MSRYHRVWVVYRKELIETLRDRRTLLAMVVVPVVLYPLLMVVLVEALKTETSRRQAEHYTICVPTEGHRLWLRAVLEREDAEREATLAAYRQAAEAADQAAGEYDSGLRAHLRSDQVTIDVIGRTESLWDYVADRSYHVGVIAVPAPVLQENEDTGETPVPQESVIHNPQSAIETPTPDRIVQMIYCDTDPRSEFVFQQLDRILAYEAERIIKARVAELADGQDLLSPLVPSILSTASSEKQFAKILALLVPFLLVTMTVTGAMYPAIDLTAGERERGTLETLAVSPVPVGQIVAGKFIVIVTIAMFSTILNLGSMTAMLHFSKLERLAAAAQPARQVEAMAVEAMINQAAAGGDRPSAGFSQADYLQQRRQLERQAAENVGFLITAAPIVLLAMIPFAVLFGGIMLAVCSFARTFKEAQNYMMPVMMAAIVPAMVVSYMPTVRLEGVILVVPVANVVILMRDLFLGSYDLPAMAICLLSTCLYAVTAVAVAAKLYGHEAVLFSDVGSYKTLLLRRFFKPQALPSAAFALLTVAVLFPLNFYWQSYMLEADSTVAWFRVVIATAQVCIFAAPPILLCWYLKVDLRRTFSLHMPEPLPMLGAVLLAVAVVPMSGLLQQIQFSIFPPASLAGELAEQQQQWLIGGSAASILLVLAVLPAICEEFLFRGFLLAGLRRGLSTGKLVLAVGVIFGLYHLNSEKIPIVSLLGVLLTFVCLRSGSILPAMVVHFANNGLALASTRIDDLRIFFGLPDEGTDLVSIQFDMRTAVFLAVFIVGLSLVALGRGGRKVQRDDTSPDPGRQLATPL